MQQKRIATHIRFFNFQYMEVVHYRETNFDNLHDDTFASTVYSFLLTGNDPFVLYTRPEPERVFAWMFASDLINGNDVDAFDLSDEEILTFADSLYAEHAHALRSLLYEGHNVKEYLRIRQSRDLRRVLSLYPYADIPYWIRTGFQDEQFLAIKDGILAGFDVSVLKPSHSERTINVLVKAFKQNIPEADLQLLIELSDHFNGDNLHVIYELYNRYGGEILSIAKAELQSLKKEAGSFLELLIVAKYCQIPVNRGSFKTSKSLTTFMEKELRKRMRDMIKREAQQKNTDAKPLIEQLNSYSYHVLLQFADLVRENANLLYFLMLFNRSEELFQLAKRCFQNTGIHPDDYMERFDVISRISMLTVKEFRDTLGREISRRIGNLINYYTGPGRFSYETLELFYQNMDRIRNLIDYAEGGFDTSVLRVIAEHPEYESKIVKFGEDTARLAHAAVQQNRTEQYGQLIKETTELLADHGVDLFSELKQAEITVKQLPSAIQTVSYIRTLLNTVKHSSEDKKQKMLQRTQKIVDVSIKQSRFFDRFQLKEIYTGVLHGVDVSVYAKPELSHRIMEVVREGLERGVDLTPYVGEALSATGDDIKASKVLNILLRFLTGKAPPATWADFKKHSFLKESYLDALKVYEQVKPEINQERKQNGTPAV